MPKLIALICVLLCFAIVADAQEEREFRILVNAELERSGLMAYLLPRFALKTARRAKLVSEDADLRFEEPSENALPIFGREGHLFAVVVVTENSAAKMFADWLASDIGKTAISAFVPKSGDPYVSVSQIVADEAVSFQGDAMLGAELAETHCGRCHRVRADRSGMGIGSTPSFRALRALPDWDDRFSTFYALNPHPAFLRVIDIGPPFDPLHPPAIHPVELTLTEVEAIQAYAAALEPADLGATVKSN